MKEEWPYTLEKHGMFWHWTLRTSKESYVCWSDCAWTRRGARRAMNRLKKRTIRERTMKEKGAI